jgi:hypothetical protein
VLAGLPWELPFEEVVGVKHASVKLPVAHLPVRTLFQMDDTKVFLEVVGLVAEVHAVQAVICLALEFQALLILDLQERFSSRSREG